MEKYGFVYIWRDRKHKRYYIGSHWGTETDGYICSSRWMRQSYKRRPEDFKRRILARNIPRLELLKIEFKWLQMIKDHELGRRYYNQSKKHFGHWAFNDEERRKTIGKKISEAHKRHEDWGYWGRGKIVSDETKEKNRQATLKQFSDKEARKRHSDISKKLWENDEYKELNRKLKLGRIWITNGINDFQIFENTGIPDGFYRGRSRYNKNKSLTDKNGQYNKN